MSKTLPARPSLDFLKKLAKDRLRILRTTNRGAQLAEAQLAVAREYGFPSWRQLKSHLESQAQSITDAQASARASYRDPFVAALPERRKAHKIVQWKPIMDAALAGDLTRVERLLDAGADPNAISTTPQRYRPLHRVIERKKTMPKHEGHDAVVKLLLARGADPHLRAMHTPVTTLQLAGMDSPRFVKPLRKHFDALDIFHAAVLADDRRVANLLKADAGLARARDVNGLTALHYCAASAMFNESQAHSDALLGIARQLIDAGADPNGTFQYDEWPISVLYFSAGAHNNPALTELLVAAGGDPCDNEAVYHASDEGHAECLAVFDRHVAPRKLATECTRTLATQLHWGHTRGATWLLAHGADPNYLRPETGNSALHAAAGRTTSEKIVTLLLAHGADPAHKNAKGETACLIAKRAKAWRVLELLEASPKTTKKMAAKTKAHRRSAQL